MHSHPASDPTTARISDEAANWCIRVNEPDFTEQERHQLDCWLSSDPAHQREYDAMLEIWTVSEHLPTDVTLEVEQEHLPDVATNRLIPSR